MAVTLIINGQSTEANAALSLFDQAEAMGIKHLAMKPLIKKDFSFLIRRTLDRDRSGRG